MLQLRDWKISPLRRVMVGFATLAFLSAVAAAVSAVVLNLGLGWVVTAAAAVVAGGVVAVLPDPIQIATRASDWRLVGSPLEPYRIKLRKPRPHPRLRLIQQLLSFPT
ncbi:MAG: hypothetical protein OEM94_07275 [Acidimicrobiia bacterium]|nr:hypothetical protein [Acidimicrobiia bacterium]